MIYILIHSCCSLSLSSYSWKTAFQIFDIKYQIIFLPWYILMKIKVRQIMKKSGQYWIRIYFKTILVLKYIWYTLTHLYSFGLDQRFFPLLSFFPPLLMHAFNSWTNSVNEWTLISLSGSKNSELLISKFLEPVFWNRALFCFLSLCSFSVSLLDVLSLFKCSFLVLDYPVSFVQHLFKMYLFILNKAPLFLFFFGN